MPEEEVAVEVETTDVLPDIPEMDSVEEETGNAPEASEPEDSQQQAAPELSAEEKLEQDARDKGWKPYEDWAGDGHDGDAIHLNPKEFLSQRWIRGKLRDTERVVRSQNKEIANLKGRHDFLTEHYEKLSEASRKEEIAGLQERRRVHEEEGNHEEARRLDAEIVEVASQPAQKQEHVEVDPSQGEVFQEWLGKNQWYASNQELQDYAKREGDKLYAQRPDLDEKQFLDELSKITKQAHPDVFGIKPQRKPPVVDKAGGRKKILGGELVNIGDFSSEEQAIIREAVSMGGYKDEQDYINKLAKTGVLK